MFDNNNNVIIALQFIGCHEMTGVTTMVPVCDKNGDVEVYLVVYPLLIPEHFGYTACN